MLYQVFYVSGFQVLRHEFCGYQVALWSACPKPQNLDTSLGFRVQGFGFMFQVSGFLGIGFHVRLSQLRVHLVTLGPFRNHIFLRRAA